MDMIDRAIERYAAEHTTPPPPHLALVAAVTRERTQSPQMRSGLVEARLLEALVLATGAARVLEIGTFTGYGALAIAARLPADGRVITIESDEEYAALARDHIGASPDAAKVDLRVGDARELVPALDGPFDLVFVDAWKPDYAHYYEAAPEAENTRALQAFNDMVQADTRVHNALLTVGDGLLIIWRAG